MNSSFIERKNLGDFRWCPIGIIIESVVTATMVLSVNKKNKLLMCAMIYEMVIS